MTVTVGIIQDAACAGIAESWLGGPSGGPEVVVSPPASVEELAGTASVIILAVADERLPGTMTALRSLAAAQAAVVSTSCVVPLEVLRTLAGAGPTLFRAVISPGCDPGEAVVALAPEPGTPAEAVELVTRALGALGTVEIVAEDALDAVAALVFGSAGFLAEALQGLEEGAVRDGLPRDTARAFAHQTGLATALLLRDHPGSPADLKDQVASPGGTTIAALATLEDAGVRGAYIRAVQRTAVEIRRRRDAARSGVIE